MERKPNFLRNAAIAGVLATAELVAAPVVSHEANAGVTNPSEATITNAATKKESCGATDKWIELTANVPVSLKTHAAVVSFDGSVDGKPQMDNVGETATLVALKSKDKLTKSWLLETQYGGSAFVLKCGANWERLYTEFGRLAVKGDLKLGRNNPNLSVLGQVNVK